MKFGFLLLFLLPAINDSVAQTRDTVLPAGTRVCDTPAWTGGGVTGGKGTPTGYGTA